MSLLPIDHFKKAIASIEEMEADHHEAAMRQLRVFLQRYGYMPTSAGGSPTEPALINALGRYQEFNNLPKTGKLDSETVKKMCLSRCQLPDPGLAVASTVCRWEVPYLTYAFGPGTASISAGNEHEPIRKAFETWSLAGAPMFREVGMVDRPHIKVEWTSADCPDTDMTGVSLAHADFPPGRPFYSASLPRPIHFDDEEHTWGNGAEIDAYDVQTVGLHEIGHVLGLHHSDVSNSVMQPTFRSGDIRRSLASDDIEALRSLYKGRLNIHSIDNNGLVVAQTETLTWGCGWTSAKPYHVGGKNYLFLLRQSTGEVRICELTGNGEIGKEIEHYKWTNNWSIVQFFRIASDTYLFAYKQDASDSSESTMKIHRINPDGTIGHRVDARRWDKGWTAAQFFNIAGRIHLFILRKQGFTSAGHSMHIYQINADGSLGPRTDAKRWTDGWTTVKSFEAGGEPFLLAIKERGFSASDHSVHIHRLSKDGTLGPRVDAHRWQDGWTAASPFYVKGSTFLTVARAGGYGVDGHNFHTYRINSDGTLGALFERHTWDQGWTTMEHYYAEGRPRLLLLKRCHVG